MIDFKTISKIFSDFIEGKHGGEYKKHLHHLIWINIKTNKILWDLEDLVRLSELGDKQVADIKKEIDKNNQIRNNLIREMDIEIASRMGIYPGSHEEFYSESPGMIIDRLAIIFIKLLTIRKLLPIITENDLREEYQEKENIVLGQFDRIGNFLDSYFSRLTNKEIFFEVQQPVKIYNDARIRKYIEILRRNRKDRPNSYT